MSAHISFELVRRISTIVLAALTAASCGATARLPVASGIGPQPALPPPDSSMIPTMELVSAKGWSGGETPVAAQGSRVAPFARGLDHPRWVYVLPNGDVLVAETNAPPRPEDAKGSGYKVIFVPFKDGKPVGNPVDVLTGFVKENGDAMGRPVGVAIDKNGGLLVADDVGNTIWRVNRDEARASR
jgi:glucose/arabinose dehydrogenase